MNYFVTINMFSGRRDPTWELSLSEYEQLADLLNSSLISVDRDPFGKPGLLGYRGITVVERVDNASTLLFRVFDSVILRVDPISRRLVADADGRVEKFLLTTHANPLAEDEKEYVRRRISENEKHRSLGTSEITAPPRIPREHPPNNFAPVYAPAKWNTDLCFQAHNNCYNYATDTLNSSWAQPGMSCGESTSAPYYCEATRLAAECDGLIVTKDSTIRVYEGHICALFVSRIYGFYDYHWFRLDADGMWSHKVGGGPATNLDSSKTMAKPISDPLACDRGDYDQFCSFFRCIPTRIEILGGPKLC